MADPLSITSGILAVLQLASSVVQYLNAVKGGSDDRHKLIAEIGSITGFLYLLKDSTDTPQQPTTPSTTLKSLCIPNGPLDLFKDALNEVISKLRPASGGFRKAGKALLWPFQQSEINSILYRIERQKTMFGLALQNDNNQLTRLIAEDLSGMRERLQSVYNSIENIETARAEQEKEKILNWISPLDFRSKHHDVLSKRHPGTGQWLLDSPQFISWRKGESKLLWCTGIPGAGKTVLASAIIDSLEREFLLDREKALAYLYCSYQDPEHISRNLIASILRQSVHRQYRIPDRIKRFYNSHLSESTRPSMDELMVELQMFSCDFAEIFIVVDALDECTADKEDRLKFLEAWQEVGDRVHLLITSRTTINICDILCTAVCMEIDAKDFDIVRYLEGRIATEHRLQRNINGDSGLQETIIDTILRSAKGMFLLARLHLDSLAKKHNRRDIRMALNRLPQELYGTYDETLKRIMSQDEDDVLLAKNILIWVSYSERPLTVKELQHALAVQPGAPDLDGDALIDEEILVSVCLGVVTVEPESGIVRLIHYTAQEYFEKHPPEEELVAETLIAKTCLAYLGFAEFARGAFGNHELLSTRLERYPFLWYAARWWGVHLRYVSAPDVLTQALQLLRDEPRIRAAGELMYTFDDGSTRCYPKDFTALHIVATFGLHSLARLLLQDSFIDFNRQDEYGQTALSVACCWGHTTLVDQLLGLLTIDIEAGNYTHCGTALHAAVRGSHEQCIEWLFCAGANIAARTAKGSSPLHLAADNGDVGMIKHLLMMGANPRAISTSGSTPVYRAARNGSVEAVKVLLQAGGQIACVTRDNWTPLHEAVDRGHTNLVKYLLSLGADTAIRTEVGDTLTRQSPLEMAIFLGRDEIVELLTAAQRESEPSGFTEQATDLPLRSLKRRATSED